MAPKRLGNALFDVGCYASGGTLFFLLVCGGGRLWFNNGADNPFLAVVAWGLIVVLGGGLLLAAVGYVLREASDEPVADPDLASRVTKLEAEVTRLRALLALPPDPSDPTPPASPEAAPQRADIRFTDAARDVPPPPHRTPYS